LIRGRLRDFLHGVWLGHPLHPMLVQVPVGAWLSASVLDVLPGMAPAATVLVATGTAAAVPAVAAGWTDWADLAPEQRRVGLVHAGTIAMAIGLQTGSLAARLAGRPKAGRALSFAALALAGAGAYIGGHLAYRQAAAVNNAAPQLRLISDGWHHVCDFGDLTTGRLTVRDVDGVPVLLSRDGDAVTALIGRCAHQSGPLGEGEIVTIGGTNCVVCPLHGSTFALSDGAVVRGPAATDQPLLRSRILDGRVEVALP
jgi:nitrite reductase/ring-hydroxylating ferredoxin subunit/uncharacterized membrane protein